MSVPSTSRSTVRGAVSVFDDESAIVNSSRVKKGIGAAIEGLSCPSPGADREHPARMRRMSHLTPPSAAALERALDLLGALEMGAHHLDRVLHVTVHRIVHGRPRRLRRAGAANG